MKRCERCGNLNIEIICAVCGYSLSHSTAMPPPLPPEASSIRPGLLNVAVTCLVALVFGIGFARASLRFKAEAHRVSSEAAAAEQAHLQAVEESTQESDELTRGSEASHRASLSDSNLLSGRTAQLVHGREWARRLSHEPSLATSALETNVLRMERVGGDPTIAAQEALRQVALLAAPPGSRVEVLPEGVGFGVRVAYKLSAVTQYESGISTKHHTVTALRREIESLSAGLVKQLFDYCGSRGIEKLSVSCNRAVRETPIPAGATAAEREELLKSGEMVMRSLHRISIRAASAQLVSDWRAVSASSVLSLVVLEKDGLRDLKISNLGRAETWDPKMPLEF
jgi:hypothetical protein